jgi:hypothetical protein
MNASSTTAAVAATSPLEKLRKNLQTIIGHIKEYQGDILTEEGAKTAFILPFIQTVWGYNIFIPTEVMPEYNAEVGLKKGEKVDYAILQNGSPVMIIECKGPNEHLTVENASQLFRYFTVTPARIGVLTNGITYKFYSDTEEMNKMDLKPFLEFDMRDLNLQDEELLRRIFQFSKSQFNLDDAAKAAVEIKYVETMRQHLFRQLQEPSDEFVAYLAGTVFPGRKTAKVVEQFRPLVRKAFDGFVSDRVTHVVKAMNVAAHNSQVQQGQEAAGGATSGAEIIVSAKSDADTGKEIITTAEELEGFYIVKSIVHDVVQPERIAYKDTLSYFTILLDGNVRKAVCRLYFNREKKFIGLFDTGGERKYELATLGDIYKCAESLKKTVGFYEAKTERVMM